MPEATNIFKGTVENKQKVLDVIEAGGTKLDALRAVDASEASLKTWRQKDADFDRRYKEVMTKRWGTVWS